MDPATITTIITEILKYGTAGLIILVLMFVIWHLWADNKSHITARLADQEAFRNKLSDLVSNSITATKDLSNMIELLKEKLSK